MVKTIRIDLDRLAKTYGLGFLAHAEIVKTVDKIQWTLVLEGQKGV